MALDPEATEAQHRRLILEAKRRRDEADTERSDANLSLARRVRAAKVDKVKHVTVAEWLGITRDGLTKFLRRWPDASGS